MNERGLGFTADILILAILVSLSFAILFSFNQAEAEIIKERYAASFARNALLALLNCTADQLGGFSYQAGFRVPELDGLIIQDMVSKNFYHKDIRQLLAEDVLLNLKLKIVDKTIDTIWSNEDMNKELTALLKIVLDELVGSRFGYRFSVKAIPFETDLAKLDFNLVIENLSSSGVRLCSETVLLPLPISNDELMKLLECRVGPVLPLGLEMDPTIEVNLEFWSR
ncbi:MAG: hypothetical protein H5T49_06260 [Hadesarchaea archaeon]|nr:hypothetical protein [Hadesarchaea archaeon]